MEWSDKQVGAAETAIKQFEYLSKLDVKTTESILLSNTLQAALNSEIPEDARNGARSVLASEGVEMVTQAERALKNKAFEKHGTVGGADTDLGALVRTGVASSRDMATEAMQKHTEALNANTAAIQAQGIVEGTEFAVGTDRPIVGKHSRQATAPLPTFTAPTDSFVR